MWFKFNSNNELDICGNLIKVAKYDKDSPNGEYWYNYVEAQWVLKIGIRDDGIAYIDWAGASGVMTNRDIRKLLYRTRKLLRGGK